MKSPNQVKIPSTQHPFPRQTLVNPELVIDVSVKSVHEPVGLLLQHTVQRVFLLLLLWGNSKGIRIHMNGPERELLKVDWYHYFMTWFLVYFHALFYGDASVDNLILK